MFRDFKNMIKKIETNLLNTVLFCNFSSFIYLLFFSITFFSKKTYSTNLVASTNPWTKRYAKVNSSRNYKIHIVEK